MTVQRQLVSVPFAAGLETKQDDKQLGPAQLTTLENAVFSSPGKLRKRNGVDRVTAQPYTGSAPPTAGVLAYRDELLATDGRSLVTLGGDGDWLDRGAMVQAIPSQRQIHRGRYDHIHQDSIRHPSAGVTLFAWLELATKRIRYSITDDASGAVLVDGAQASDPVAESNVLLSRVKVGVVGGHFVILWVRSVTSEVSTTHALRWVTVNASTLAAETEHLFAVLRTTSPSQPGILFDVTTSPDGLVYVVYRSGVTLEARTVEEVSGTPEMGRTIDFAPGVSLSAVQSVGVFIDPGAEQVITLWSEGAIAYFSSWTYSLDPVETGVHIIDLGSTFLRTMTGVTVGSNRYVVANDEFGRLRVYDLINGQTEITVRPGIELASKPFAHDGALYFFGTNDAGPRSLFLFDAGGRPVARMLPGLTTENAYGIIPEVSQIGPGEWEVSALIRTRDQSRFDWPGTYTTFGLNAVRVAFDPVPYPSSLVAGGTLLVGGGIVRAYDGGIHGEDDAGRPLCAVEHGFLTAPPAPETEDHGGSHTYSYVAVYAWTDAQGSVHRSEPSAPTVVRMSAPIGGGGQAVSVPPLRLSAKASEAQIELYRTTDGGSVFYRCAIAENDPAADVVTFHDTLTDAQLEDELQVYTTGNVVENTAPPPSRILAWHRNRVWLVDAMNPVTMWFSKTVLPGSPVEFSDIFVKAVEEAGGEVTALASLDDKLIVFKADRIYVVTGQGPDDTGGNDDLSDASRISSDVGCICHRSVVVTPAGVLFRSRKGIYLLDRSLSVQYVGAPVEAFNEQRTTAAVLVPDAHQVRFVTDSGAALVYDYLVGQWSTFTGYEALDATVRGASTVLAGADGFIAKETPGVYVDNRDGAPKPIGLRLVTGWMNVGTLQGFVRLRKVLVLGEWYSAHTLQLGIAYDYDAASGETVRGVQSQGGVYQWQFQPSRQKCEAVRLTLWDETTEPGQALDLSALTFEVGVKRGAMKLAGGRSMT